MLRAVAGVVGLIVAAFAGAEVERTASLRIESLSDDVSGAWLVVHERPVSANSLLVEAADGSLVLCDTPMTERATLELLAWAEEHFGERRWLVVNGHFHPDCTAGNAAMIDAGAEVWASEHTAALTEQRCQAFLDLLAEQAGEDEALAAEFRETRVAAATRVFDASEPAVLPIEGERVEIVFPGAGHAPDNVVTHFVDRGIVFAGCLCFSARRTTLGYTGDADFDSWPGALARVSAMGAGIVVPGHGAPGGPELLSHTSEIVRRGAPLGDAGP